MKAHSQWKVFYALNYQQQIHVTCSLHISVLSATYDELAKQLTQP